MSLKSRLARLAGRVERVRPSDGLPDWVTPEALDRMFRQLPERHLRWAAGRCPGLGAKVAGILAAREREGRTWLN